MSFLEKIKVNGFFTNNFFKEKSFIEIYNKKRKVKIQTDIIDVNKIYLSVNVLDEKNLSLYKNVFLVELFVNKINSLKNNYYIKIDNSFKNNIFIVLNEHKKRNKIIFWKEKVFNLSISNNTILSILKEIFKDIEDELTNILLMLFISSYQSVLIENPFKKTELNEIIYIEENDKNIPLFLNSYSIDDVECLDFLYTNFYNIYDLISLDRILITKKRINHIRGDNENYKDFILNSFQKINNMDSFKEEQDLNEDFLLKYILEME